MFNYETIYKYLLLFSLVFSATGCYSKSIQEAELSKFNKWKTKLRSDTLRQGYDSKFTDQVFDVIFLSQHHVTHDKKQFHPQTFSEYYKNAINNLRINKAKKRLQWHKESLIKIENIFSIPREYILALWGIESDFGTNTGEFYIINSLANLAYEGRRKDFFESEFFAALKILKQENIAPTDFKGSWAGATGQCQFMPSTYLAYAIDFDGDNNKDIWNNKQDVFASIANYLRAYDWDNNLPWGYEIRPSVELEDLSKKNKSYKLDKIVNKYQIKRINNKDYSLYELKSKVKVIQYDNRFFILFKNFDIIKRWNNSNYFALTIGLFADEIQEE